MQPLVFTRECPSWQLRVPSYSFDASERGNAALALLSFMRARLPRTSWLIFTLMLGLVCARGWAQAPFKEWDKRYGGSGDEPATVVIKTSDGGYLLGGSTNTEGPSGDVPENGFYGSYDFWVVKTSSTGVIQWEHTFDESFDDGMDNYLHSMIQTSDGGYLLAGTEDETIGNGSYNFLVVKISSSGAFQWREQYNVSLDDDLYEVIQTSDGGYLLAGSTSDQTGCWECPPPDGSRGGLDYWIVKISSTGAWQWDKRYGGPGDDLLYSAIATTDGGFLLGGYSASGIGGDKSEVSRGGNDYWTVKINGSGTKVWDKRFGGTADDVLSGLLATNDGGYLLAGTSSSGVGGDKWQASQGATDYWTVKINGSGSKLYEERFGGSNADNLASLVQTNDGGYLLLGTSSSGICGDKTQASQGLTDFWIVKTTREPTNSEYVMNSFAHTTCSGGFYDPGFTTTYRANRNITQTFTPATAGAQLRVNFTSFVLENGFDFLSVYDGANTSAPLLGTFTGTLAPFTVAATSPGGQLTFHFTSNATNQLAGWTASISCYMPALSGQWNKRYGGLGDDNFASVAKTSDGSYLLGGYSYSGLEADKSQPSQGGSDYWVVKLNASGAKLWDKRYGGPANEYLNVVLATSDGGFLLAGSSQSGAGGDKSQASRGDRDYWLVKLNASGAKLWDKSFGGAGFDDLLAVVPTADGGYLLGGISNSTAGGDRMETTRGGRDYWVIKINGSGTKIWDRRFGGSADDNLETLLPTADGGYLLGGYSASGSGGDKSQASQGGTDYWVVKLNASGSKLWDKRFGGTANEVAYSLAATSDGGYLLGGSSTSGIGGDKSEASRGGSDYWVVKFNSSGSKVWDKRFGGSSYEEIRSLVATTDGGFALAGTCSSGLTGDKSEASRGGSDYWLVKINSRGVKLWDKRYGGDNTDELRALLQTADQGFLLAGRSASGLNGDRSEPSRGSNDYWLIKTSPASSGARLEEEPLLAERIGEGETPAEGLQLQAAPNPFSDRVTFRFQVGETQAVKLQVYDLQGRLVATLFDEQAEAGQPYSVEFHAASHPAGMYLSRLATASQATHCKLLLTK